MNFETWWIKRILKNPSLNNPNNVVVKVTVSSVKMITQDAYNQGKQDAENDKSLFEKMFGK